MLALPPPVCTSASACARQATEATCAALGPSKTHRQSSNTSGGTCPWGQLPHFGLAITASHAYVSGSASVAAATSGIVSTSAANPSAAPGASAIGGRVLSSGAEAGDMSGAMPGAA